MATKSISQLETIGQLNDGDLFEVAHPDSGSSTGYVSGRESIAQVGDYIAKNLALTGLNTTADTLVGAVNELKAENETTVSNIADAYDNTATYAEGDYCIYNGVLYKCNTDILVAESFDSTKWDATIIADELGSAQSLHEYSTTEQRVGTWTNGKPVYESLVEVSMPSSTYTNVSTPHGIADIDEVVEYRAFAVFPSGTVQLLNGIQFDGNGLNTVACIFAQFGTTDVTIMVGTDRSTVKARFIARYTKTTDTASS